MSTYAATDRCTDTLLDELIAPGESRGNYNAVIGRITASDPLEKKTIAAIYRLMASRLSAGMPSTAIGRYQIIRRTLQTLQETAKLAPTELFTPELQDRLALALMIGRGYSRWWRGTMTDEAFLHSLSMEWASLPDPYNGGRSHYDGIAGNHAGMTLAHAEAVIAKAKGLKT